MKSLPPAPLTSDDLQAYSYCYGFVEGPSWDAVMINVRLADRRDATLMLLGQNFRALGHECEVFDLDADGLRIWLGGEKTVIRGADRL